MKVPGKFNGSDRMPNLRCQWSTGQRTEAEWGIRPVIYFIQRNSERLGSYSINGGEVKKKYVANKEMSDPDWIHKKQQDYFALKAAFQRFEWGSAYIPQACFDAAWRIRLEIERMDEPIKVWKAEKPIIKTLNGKKDSLQ